MHGFESGDFIVMEFLEGTGFPEPLERCRSQHPHSETSQGRVRKTAIVGFKAASNFACNSDQRERTQKTKQGDQEAVRAVQRVAPAPRPAAPENGRRFERKAARVDRTSKRTPSALCK